MSPEETANQRHSNRHHVYPKSRVPAPYRAGGRRLLGNWLVLPNVPAASHSALHAIFGNRTPEEQSKFLKKICADDILNLEIYTDYKKLFDILFGGDISFIGMAETLKKWDLSKDIKQKYADKLSSLLKNLNDDIKGGIPLRKYKIK